MRDTGYTLLPPLIYTPKLTCRGAAIGLTTMLVPNFLMNTRELSTPQL